MIFFWAFWMTFQTQNTVDGHNFAPALRIPPSQPEENDAFFFPQTNKSADLSWISTKQLDNYVLHGRYKKHQASCFFLPCGRSSIVLLSDIFANGGGGFVINSGLGGTLYLWEKLWRKP